MEINENNYIRQLKKRNEQALTYVRKYIDASRKDLMEQMPELEDEKAGREFLRREYE